MTYITDTFSLIYGIMLTGCGTTYHITVIMFAKKVTVAELYHGIATFEKYKYTFHLNIQILALKQ